MKWVRDTNLAAHNVRVPCLVCGSMLLLADAWIDRDGPAFQAYYHKQCKPHDPTLVECYHCKRNEAQGCDCNPHWQAWQLELGLTPVVRQWDHGFLVTH